jgi:hypothetical protein
VSDQRLLGEDAAEREDAASSRGLTLEWASRLSVRDVNVISVVHGGKVAAEPWQRWTRDHQDEVLGLDLDEWLCKRFGDRDSNLAVVCGASSGIVVLDTDDDVGEALVASTCAGQVPETVRVTTAKGSHYWFAHPGGVIHNRARIGGASLDVRGDGGYVLVPPSLHPSGTRYEWLVSPLDLWPPAPLPKELHALISPVAGTEKSSHERPRRLQSPVLTSIGSRYARAALEREVENVRAAAEGTRNDALNRGVFAVARFVRTRELDAAEIASVFLAAAASAGLGEHEARATIASALMGRA